MSFKLVRYDSPEPAKYPIANNRVQIIGRSFPDCNSLLISRKHAELSVHGETVNLKAIGPNPCFYKRTIDNVNKTLLPQGDSVDLANGDRFGLLPDQNWYELIYFNDNQKAMAEKTQENRLARERNTEDTTYRVSPEANETMEGDQTMLTKRSHAPDPQPRESRMRMRVATENHTGPHHNPHEEEDARQLDEEINNIQAMDTSTDSDITDEPTTTDAPNDDRGETQDNLGLKNPNDSDTDTQRSDNEVDVDKKRHSTDSVNEAQESGKNNPVTEDAIPAERAAASRIDDPPGNDEEEVEVPQSSTSEVVMKNEPQSPKAGVPVKNEPESPKADVTVKNESESPKADVAVKNEPQSPTGDIPEKKDPGAPKPGPSDDQAGQVSSSDDAVPPKPTLPARERCIYGAACYRKNAQHKAQFSHPGDPDHGAGERGQCPYGARCRRADPRHWAAHAHPAGTAQPAARHGPGVRVVRRHGNIFYVTAHAVHFHDNHFEIDDEDGHSESYDYDYDDDDDFDLSS